MNIFSKNKILKYLIYFMIIFQGILISALASFYMDSGYLDKIMSYPNSAFYINIKSIPNKNISNTLNYMKDFAKENGVFYIRKDFIINKKIIL